MLQYVMGPLSFPVFESKNNRFSHSVGNFSKFGMYRFFLYFVVAVFVFVFCLFCFLVYETGFLCIALAVLELTL